MSGETKSGVVLSKLYDDAMENWSLAYIARNSGDMSQFAAYSKDAFLLAVQAAEMLSTRFDAEPTRSIVCKMVAEIALQIGDTGAAIKYSAMGLSGQPYDDIALDLHGIMQNATHHIHYKVKGLVLSNDEMQISFTGDAVGYGYIPYKLLLGKMEVFESLLMRTAERHYNLKFRRHGKIKSQVKERIELFAGVPKAASYAFNIKVGQNSPDDLFDTKSQIISEFLRCIEYLEAGNMETLKEAITDPLYYNNFIALVKELAPDGKMINNIYFTRSDNTHIQFTKTREKIAKLPTKEKYSDDRQPISARGFLDRATALEDEDIIRVGRTSFRVPLALEDVVSMHWRKRVVAHGIKQNDRIILTSVELEN
jgi:hypothetical protein